MLQKINRLRVYIDGLGAFSSDSNSMLNNDDWIKFYQYNSEILQNELGPLKSFRNVNSQVYIKFLYDFFVFFTILYKYLSKRMVYQLSALNFFI